MFSRLILRSAALVALASFGSASYGQLAFNQAPATGVNWRTNLDAAMLEAAQTNRFVLMHFTTRTCGPCRMLDNNVFNQPQVATAMEQDYVPVRIDANAMPALAARYRIERVPTEIILSPAGEQLASPPIPDKPEAFTSQLQNLARHFRTASSRQTTPGAPQQDVNSAYAGLPVSNGAAASNPTAFAVSQQQQQQTPPAPQAQSNPYLNAPSNPYANAPADPQTHGQAASVYGAPMQPMQQMAASSTPTAPAPPHSMAPAPHQQPATPTVPAGAADAATGWSVASQTPAMPANAMPRSYPSTEGVSPNAAAALAHQAPQAKPPRQQELPAGSPPMAFDGCCPVTLKTLNKWAYGDPQYGVIHRGRSYLFAGPQQRDQFLAAPDSYSPVFAGKDPVLLIDSQQAVDGSRSFGYRYGDMFYLFSSKETMEKFKAAPQAYAAGVRQAMSNIDAAGDGVVRR